MVKKIFRFAINSGKVLTAALAELGHFPSARKAADERLDGKSDVPSLSSAGLSAETRPSEQAGYTVHPDDCQYGDNDLCYLPV